MEQILQKVTEAITNDFVGNYVFSDDELSKVYDFTGKLLRSYDCGWGNSISNSYDPLVFVAMVNAVKTWKSDEDTFWDCIYKKLMGTAGSQKIYLYLTNVISRDYTISDFVTLLTNYFTSQKSFARSNSEEGNLTIVSRQNAWVAMLNELARYSSSTSLTSLGQIQFEYRGNTSDIVESIAEMYHSNPVSVKSLLDLLAFEIVKMGAIFPDSDSDIDDNDREYIFFTPSQRFITYLQSPDKKRSTVSNWMPKSKENGNGYYKSNRLYYVCKTLGISEQKAIEFLEQYYEYLTKPEFGNPYCMDDINKDGTFVLRAKNFAVRINGSPNTHWYKCKKCGKVTQFNLGRCPSVRCEGELFEVDPDDVSKNNHFTLSL